MVHLDDAALAELVDTGLSSEEKERAGRFRNQRQAQRFASARVALRHLLASYLHCDTRSVALGTAPGGKPRLEPVTDRWLCFNLSHSDEMALVGVSRGREIGVDLERLRDDVDLEGLVARVMSPPERRLLSRLPPKPRQAAFYRFWARKEAYLKGLGTGFQLEPRAVHVTGEGPAPDGWVLHDLDVGPGYAAALAVEGRGPVRLRQMTLDC